MVKKKLGGSKKRKPVKPAADSTAAATDQDGDGPEPPSHGADGQPNKQKGRTEQINGSKARRAVTQVETTRMQQYEGRPFQPSDTQVADGPLQPMRCPIT
ncbi:hypothetical protein WJX79_008110 [Trebouxia sp. C0005]